VISLAMFTLGETVVPLCAQRVEELYQQDIKKKVELGTYSRENYWYRDGTRFFNIAHYDSRLSLLKELTIFEFNGAFELTKRIEAEEAEWGGPQVGWIMKRPVEVTFEPGGKMRLTPFRQLPLVIEEQPEDFYNMKRDPETLNYRALDEYVVKLKSEGVPVTPYLVELAAKLSFPLVNVILILVAFPFALGTARSGTLTRGFVAGISIGFGYYFVHALSTSLGGAELIPVYPAAWAANILFATVGGYFLAGAEYGS
jgi:lipopolysaccharide export system permease protein